MKWFHYLLIALGLTGLWALYNHFFGIKKATGKGEIREGADGSPLGAGKWERIGDYFVRPGIWVKGNRFSADRGKTWHDEEQSIHVHQWVRLAYEVGE